jgi:hypothetical protein
MDEVLPVCQLVELADGLGFPCDSRTDDGQTASNARPVVGSLRFLGFAAKRSSITSLRLLVSRKLDSQSFAQWTKAARLEIVC